MGGGRNFTDGCRSGGICTDFEFQGGGQSIFIRVHHDLGKFTGLGEGGYVRKEGLFQIISNFVLVIVECKSIKTF